MLSLILAAVVSTNVCATCSGKGKVYQTCSHCQGKGVITMRSGFKVSATANNGGGVIGCPKCCKGLASRSSRGSGRVLSRCPDCRGTGKAAVEKVQYNCLKK